MAEYPTAWESDAVLADGGTVHVRPIRADDVDGLLGLWSRLSAESIYLRFFTPMPRPKRWQLETLATVDYSSRFALVAELRGEVVAVARYARHDDPSVAEVAFVVEDEQQGRGIGTLLLEHLAAVARSNGIARFVAETLPENRRMLDVFEDAGWKVQRSFRDGLVSVSFPIEATTRSRATADERERRADVRSISRLLQPRSVAVVGAGREPSGTGHRVLASILAGGFPGPVFPVNPSATEIAGLTAHATVPDIGEAVDLAVVTVPRREVADVVADCARAGVAGVVIVTAGFAESGPEGVEAERELVTLARRHGMRLIGPNSLGVTSLAPGRPLHAAITDVEPLPGRAALLTEAAGLGRAVLEHARTRGLELSAFVSVGNRADVSVNDLLQYWEQDEATRVILCHFESVGNPRRFARIARRVARSKPIVVLHPISGSDLLIEQTGVIRVESIDELLGAGLLLANQPLPTGHELAIVGPAGPETSITTALARRAGFEVGELVTLTADAPPGRYRDETATLRRDTGSGAVLTLATSVPAATAADYEQALGALADVAGPPLATVFPGRTGVLPDDSSDGSAVPAFAFPESAVTALAGATRHAAWLARDPGSVPALPDLDLDAARDVAESFFDRNDGGGRLPPEEAAAICRRVGVPILSTRRVWSAVEAVAAAAELGGTVVLKAASETLGHRQDVGGVHLGLADDAAVRTAWDALEAALGEDMGGGLVQPMAPPGLEADLGIVHDDAFGPVVSFSIRGSDVDRELIQDAALRLLPLTDTDAHDLVRSPRRAPLLFGFRGSPALDTRALEDAALRIGALADAVPEIVRLALDPLVVTEHGAVAVDAKVRVAPAPGPRGELRLI